MLDNYGEALSKIKEEVASTACSSDIPGIIEKSSCFPYTKLIHRLGGSFLQDQMHHVPFD